MYRMYSPCSAALLLGGTSARQHLCLAAAWCVWRSICMPCCPKQALRRCTPDHQVGVDVAGGVEGERHLWLRQVRERLQRGRAVHLHATLRPATHAGAREGERLAYDSNGGGHTQHAEMALSAQHCRLCTRQERVHESGAVVSSASESGEGSSLSACQQRTWHHTRTAAARLAAAHMAAARLAPRLPDSSAARQHQARTATPHMANPATTAAARTSRPQSCPRPAARPAARGSTAPRSSPCTRCTWFILTR